MILYEKTTQELKLDFSSCGLNRKIYCQCDYCDNVVLRTKRSILAGRNIVEKDSCGSTKCAKTKREESNLLKHGVVNAGGTKESQDKAKATWLINLGVDNPGKSQEVLDKIEKTCLERFGKKSFLATETAREFLKKYSKDNFGVDHVGQAEVIKEKMRNTSKDRYGVDYYSSTKECKKRKENTSMIKHGVKNPMQNQSVKEKQQESMLCSHGVRHPLQKEEFLKKAHDTIEKRFGIRHALQNKEIYKKFTETNLKRYGKPHYLQNDLIKEKMLRTRYNKYGTTCPVNLGKTQNKIKQWLNELGYSFEPNYTVIPGKEIDLYNEELKIGIEYCGLYWHNELSPQPRTRSYHYDKYRKCLEKNVKLITIFEDEWLSRNTQCKSVLKSILGFFNERVFARKCEVKKIDKDIFRKFCDDNHLQGASNSVICFGLFLGNRLLGVMSLGKHHRNSKKIALNRLCFLAGTQVVGGASKLFKFCVDWCKDKYDSIISWSDNRWSSGTIYKVLKFNLEFELPPDYSYVSGKKRLSKQSCKKSNSKCPEDKTEREWMIESGCARIWDCGKKRWVFNL